MNQYSIFLINKASRLCRTYFSLLFVLFFSSSLMAQDYLFQSYGGQLTQSQQNIVDKMTAKETTKRIRLVTVDYSLFNTQQFTANFFSGQAPVIDYFDIGYTGVQFKTWTGHFPQRLGSASFILNGMRISGHVASIDGNFEVCPLGDKGVHMIVEHDPTKFELCGQEYDAIYGEEHASHSDEKHHHAPAPVDNSSTDIPQGSSQFKQQQASGSGNPNVQLSGTECFLRAVIAYTSGAKTNTNSLYGRTMNEHVALAIVDANVGHANSGAEQRVELAHLYATSTVETSSSSTDVNALQAQGDGRFDLIHSKRNFYDGDYCSVITDGTYSGICGRAFGFTYTNATNMFQVSEYDCIVGNFTWAHEAGHNQGLRHDNDNTGSPFSYARGYNQGSIFRTIMAVCCSPARVNYWSNPGVIFPGGGGVMGTSTRDNERALDFGDFTVAHHRLDPGTTTTGLTLGTDETLNMFASTLVNSVNTAPNGSVLDLYSHTQVKLLPGFNAQAGSDVHVYISSPCTGTSYSRLAEDDGKTQEHIAIDNYDHSFGRITDEITFNFKVFPNPFSQRATIEYALEEETDVTIYITDLLGKKVSVLKNDESHSSGKYKIEFDGSQLSEGVYHCTIKAGTHHEIQKIILAR